MIKASRVLKYTLLTSLLSCHNQATEKGVNKNLADTLQTVLAVEQQKDIYIKDKSQYDQSFIQGLADFEEQIKLVDNHIITGTDTTYFPDDLALNHRSTFTGSENDKRFALILTRTNLTNINYEFELDEAKGTIEYKSGQAILSSGFFLAPEGEPDPETGDSFCSNEYRMENDSLWLTIKVGIDKNYEGKKRAKIIYGHKNESQKSDKVVESPILRLE